MPDRDDTELLRRLRELLCRGRTLRDAERELGRSKSALGRLAAVHGLYGGIRRRGRKLPANIDRAIRRDLARGRLSVQAIARRHGVARRAVRDRREAQLVAELLREKLQVRHRPTSAWRCPACGSLVTTDPSVCHRISRPRSVPRALKRDKGHPPGPRGE